MFNTVCPFVGNTLLTTQQESNLNMIDIYINEKYVL